MKRQFCFSFWFKWSWLLRNCRRTTVTNNLRPLNNAWKSVIFVSWILPFKLMCVECHHYYYNLCVYWKLFQHVLAYTLLEVTYVILSHCLINIHWVYALMIISIMYQFMNYVLSTSKTMNCKTSYQLLSISYWSQ